MARWYPISAAAHHALTESTAYAGPRVTITDQLGPDVWPLVKTVVEKLGAVYAPGTSAFDFDPDQDARTLVTQALAAGRVMGAANSDGYVPTPAGLAEDLVRWYGELEPPRARDRRLRVLEPSAGIGRFVSAIRDQLGAEWCEITAVEPDARRSRQIPADEATTVHTETFEDFEARAQLNGWRFDVIVMNPPFSVPGRPNIWAEHLLTAWKLLAAGGRLVAIVPASVLDRRRAGLVGQAGQLVHMNGVAEELPLDAFAESGITFPTAVVALDKPLVSAPAFTPLRAPAPAAYAFRPYTGFEAPQPVTRPVLTRAAIAAMPVQVWRDAWRGGRERVLRYRAMCVTCDRPVWGFDDGENDPRGVLGDASAGFSLDPHEYGRIGMPVALCPVCGSDGGASERGLTAAHRLWDATDRALADVPAGARAATEEVTPEGEPDLFGELAATLPGL